MDCDVVQARVIEPERFSVRFADGLEGTVRFLPSAYHGVFAPLRNPTLFRQLMVSGYFVTWPGE